MRAHRILATVALATTALVLAGPASPASAAAIGTTAGPVMTVAASGDVVVVLACIGGAAGVNGAVAQPPLPCGSLAKVVVNGDADDQSVSGRPLKDNSPFTLNPVLEVDLAGGNDIVVETDRADDLDLGNGDDQLLLEAPGLPNTAVDLGPGANDILRLWTTPGNDTVAMSSTNSTVTLGATTPSGQTAYVVQDAEDVQLQSFEGNDVLNSAGVTAGSTITGISFVGDAGNDTFGAGVKGMTATGGTGNNTFNGASGPDIVVSQSTTDVIKLGSGENVVSDVSSLRSGGRSITGTGSSDTHYTELDSQDTTSRVRSGIALNTARLTNSLGRAGKQPLGADVDLIRIDFEPVDAKPDRSLADIVAVHQEVQVFGDAADDDVVDVTVRTGTWVLNEVPGGTSTINPDLAGYGTITVSNSGPISVHGPWTSTYEGFGHRVIRDLQLRIATLGERLAIRNGLIDQSTTRPGVVDDLMDSDLYRGLDVDRTFVDFLDRQADPSGRTYWINSLRNGKSLRQFRAQLFGSGEYFTRAGSTNTSYVRAAYRDVLGRLPDPTGETYWVNKIANGTDRGTVAKQFLASTEARRAIVEDQYLRFLDRLPSDADSVAWVNTLGAVGQGEQLLIASLATSEEYYLRE